MTSIKTGTLVLLLSALSITGFGQTATKPAATSPAKTSTTKTTTTVKTTPATKAPQTLNSKTTVKKTTTAKTLQKPAKPKTTVTTTTKTTTSPQIIIKKDSARTNIVTPVIQKTEPGIFIPKSQIPATQATPANTTPAPATGGRTNTGTQTTPTPTPTTGGRTRPGAGDNTTPTPTPTDGGRTNPGTGNQTTPGSIINTITEGDASSAIKEALMKGIQVGVDKVSVTNGYFGNSMIKIPFPSQVKQVESTLRSVGMGSLIDDAVLSMNRAAESAASQAAPIFINSIKQMTVSDAVNIVSNQQPDAATQFLKRTTNESLVGAFKPSIKTALDKTMATKYWSDITGYYNKIPFVSPINTDLPDYVTRKAIDGLFYMVAQEEAKIRKDPAGQANDIIKTVFGSVRR